MSLSLLGPLSALLEPERVRDMLIAGLDRYTTFALKAGIDTREDPIVCMGLRFPNAVGLAAGLDRNAQCVSAFGALGFGHVEVGGVTAEPYEGCPRPRLFRLPAARAMIHRLGYCNTGAQSVMANLKSAQAFALRGGVVGINIGATDHTALERDIAQYEACLQALYAFGDYFTLNVAHLSLHDIDQGTNSSLGIILSTLVAARNRLSQSTNCGRKPMVAKLSADITDDRLLRALDVVVACGLDGVHIGNTTLARPSVAHLRHAAEDGGLSGAPVLARTTEQVRLARDHVQQTLAVFASGGILSADDAVSKIQAGADLVQLHTGLFFSGLQLPAQCVNAIAEHRQHTR